MAIHTHAMTIVTYEAHQRLTKQQKVTDSMESQLNNPQQDAHCRKMKRDEATDFLT